MPPSERFKDLKSLDDLKVSRRDIPSHGLLPNSGIHQRPLLIYHGAFPSFKPKADKGTVLSITKSKRVSANAIEAHVRFLGITEPSWRNTIDTTTHFYSNAHAVLCVSIGKARLRFGGDDNPGKVDAVVRAGDVIVVPAGLAFRLVEDLGEDDFQVTGSYPKGCEDWDMCYGTSEEAGKVEAIRSLPWFTSDPIYGEQGPVMNYVQMLGGIGPIETSESPS